MKVGDPVNWRYVPRGGYAFPQFVAGVIIKFTAKRVQIRVAVKRNGEWSSATKSVTPESLTPRSDYVFEVDG